MPAAIDITGMVFGETTVINIAGFNGKRTLWRVRCSCGRESERPANEILAGRAKRCRYCAAKTRPKRPRKPRGKRNFTYNTWASMVQRCENTNNHRYADYGGRGIKICERWRSSFRNFLSDMGEKPAGMSIDRIDNDKGYEPSNCRWATPKQQVDNRRNKVTLTFNGETLPTEEWASRIGIRKKTIDTRIKRGWPPADCVIPKLLWRRYV